MVFSMVNRTWKWRNLTTEIYLFNWIKVIVSVYFVCAVCVRTCVCVYCVCPKWIGERHNSNNEEEEELKENEKYLQQIPLKHNDIVCALSAVRVQNKRNVVKLANVVADDDKSNDACPFVVCRGSIRLPLIPKLIPQWLEERDWAQCNAQWNEIVKYWSISGRNSMSRWWW